MKMHGIIIMITSYMTTLCNCSPHSRSITDKNISKFKASTGEPVAVAHLIQAYELEHLHLFQKEVNKSNILEWNDLEHKNLHDYCRKYLYQCVPGRTTCEATGIKSGMKLRYTTPGYELLRNNVVVVTCVNQLEVKTFYHLTRALEPNCVYALTRARGGCAISYNFTIIYKHCNFEFYDYDRNRKRKRTHIKKVHHWHHNGNVKFKMQFMNKDGNFRHETTGQFIADDKSIMKYELEHQEMRIRDSPKDFKQWPFVMQHRNLNEYCYKYLNLCIPNKMTEDIKGSWRLQKVKWRSNEEHIEVVVVKCYSPVANRSYYFTRALSTNCVYALLRDGKQTTDPFLIIFRYCNFDQPAIKQEDPMNSGVADITLHEKVKTDLPTETLQLFQNN